MKHLSALVKPGARRVEVSSGTGYEDVLAFRNVDGTIAIVAHNSMSKPQPLRIMVKGKLLDVELPADSFASISL